MPKRYDHHEENVILHGVDDAVVPDANPQTWAALQRPGRWRSWVLRKQSNCALDAPPRLGVEFAKRPRCSWPELDAVRALPLSYNMTWKAYKTAYSRVSLITAIRGGSEGRLRAPPPLPESPPSALEWLGRRHRANE